MRLEMIRRVIMLCILMTSIFAFQSVEAIAIGFCVSNWIDALVSMVPVRQLLGYGIKKQIWDLWKILLASAIMFAVVQVMIVLNMHALLLLAVQIFIGVLVYVVVSCILKIESQVELMKLVVRLMKDRRS